MKKYLIAILVLFTFLAYANVLAPVTIKIKVFGNCGQCKERIEAALDHKGIKSAEWNIDTKILEVVYVPEKITEEQIHHYIAGVGHDTEKVKAFDTVYQQLPDCCLYREKPNTHHD